MKVYGGVDAQIHVFLTSALVGGKWSASRPCRLTPEEKYPVTTGYEAGWAPEPVWTKWRKNSCPYRDWNSYPSIVQPVACRYTDWAIPATASVRRLKIT
jgi:hypothetical protein